MPKFSPAAIRTVALTGHGGSGKTTLAEALLANAGAINSPGSVDKGTTVCDFDPLEKQYQHSLNAAVAHLQHRDTRVHLVDTPGLQANMPIFEAAGVAFQSSGFFHAAVTSKGTFSAKLLNAGKSYSMSGHFSATGASSNSVVRKGLSPLTVLLQLNLAGEILTGQVSDGVWMAE